LLGIKGPEIMVNLVQATLGKTIVNDFTR